MPRTIPEAEPLAIRAVKKGKYTSTAVYRIPGHDGVWRRISREGRTGLKAGQGAVVALCTAGKRMGETVDTLAEFVRWDALETVLCVLLPPDDPAMEQDAHEVPDGEMANKWDVEKWLK